MALKNLNNNVYVLDTNVLIFDPESLFSFENSIIIISIFTLEELDILKKETSERGYNARTVIRSLDTLRLKGSLQSGVDLGNNSILKIVFICNKCSENVPLEKTSIDNQILITAYCLKQKGNNVKFISKDINARVKADILNLETSDYSKDNVNKENLYKGWTSLKVPSIELKRENPDILINLAEDKKLITNQFILLESQSNQYNLALYRYLGNNKFKKITNSGLNLPLEPKNIQQLMALDLLLDDSIKLITLLGPAGTGKTFLTLLAGLDKVLIENIYEKILVTRPVIPLGPDIGYLPGDVQEKLLSWMQPVYDNMDYIMHSIASSHVNIYREDENLKKSKKIKNKNSIHSRYIPSIQDLLSQNKITFEAITYMRGRSIAYQYILIDEVQNLTPHEVKTLITRVGQGSKIILSGDPYQIDSLYLDFATNGLVVTTDKFKGYDLFGTVYLEISERSELSRLAGELL